MLQSPVADWETPISSPQSAISSPITDGVQVSPNSAPVSTATTGGDLPHFYETMSDVTSTDFIGESETAIIPDEKSVGHSVNASISSGASSLPSLASDAPLLALKDIGQYGMAFVRKLIDTQMYSNYCQWNKSSSDRTPALDGSIYRLPGSPIVGAPLRTDLDMASSILLSPKSADRDNNDNVEKNFDSLVEVFFIGLTGTVAMDAIQIQQQQAIYTTLYPTKHVLSDILNLSELNNTDRIEQFTKKVCKHSRALRRYIDKKILTRFNDELQDIQSKFHIDDFLACNGLICHGYCNTVICSEICANIWEKKVRKLRHQQAAYDIVCKRYEKHKHIKEEEPSSVVEMSKSKIEYITSSGARLEAVQHKRETLSQFHLRKAVIASSITTTVAATTTTSPGVKSMVSHQKKKHSPSSKHRRRHRKQHGREENVRARLFTKATSEHTNRTFASTTDTYILTLAKYFAKKEDKYIKKYYRRCQQRIQRFLSRFITYYRKKHYLQSIIYMCVDILFD
jgi:hypothetical protein